MTSYRSTTRTLFAALAAAAVLLLSATTAQANPPAVVQTQVVTQDIGFAYCQFVACGNSGAGEWVSFTGKNRWIGVIEQTADNRVVVTWKLSVTEANGEGLESGEAYTSKKETTELIAVSFYSMDDLGKELTANVHWRGNVAMADGNVNVPLLFTGEIKFIPNEKQMKFNFEEIETNCRASFTLNQEQ